MTSRILVPSLSIVIPVFNSEQSLPVLFERLDTMLPLLAEQSEVIMVNDGSRDNSAPILDSAAHLYPWLRVIHLMRNYDSTMLCCAGSGMHRTTSSSPWMTIFRIH